MRFTQTFFVAAALAAVGFADDGPCDPQNDNGVVCSNGIPVSSDGVAIAADTATVTDVVAAPTTSLGSRISLISSTDTDILVSTSTNLVFGTTSLPASLDTRTATSLNTIVQTKESVYTTNTLGNTPSNSLSKTVATSTNTVITGVAALSGAAASSTSTDNFAALQTAGKYAPFGVAVAALGFAAAL